MSLGRLAFAFTIVCGVFSPAFSAEKFVTYEKFGAIGDGVHDDLPAICEVHEYANAHGLSVRTKPDATYHLGSQALTAIIATDTDWNTSRFTVDDTNVANREKSLFEVRSLLNSEKLQIDRLTRDQRQLDVRPEHDCHVVVMNKEVGYNYWARNIVIKRSNTEVDGLTHHVVGETSVGHAYSGFLAVSNCANVTLRNCFASAHKTYKTIGATGTPVSLGAYDYTAHSVVNFTMINCRMEDVCDRSRWGVIETNFCKNILLEDCTLNRMDTHMSVSGAYIIRRCTLGYAGLNAIGRGLLLVEESTLCGYSLVNFRGDYGATWEGDVVIRNCRWIPACGRKCRAQMFHVGNDGTHDFGYDCYMPHEITIDGLYVDDSNHPEGYQGVVFLSNPGGSDPTDSAFPYARCQKLTVRGLTTASGMKPRVSPNAQVENSVVLVEEPPSSDLRIPPSADFLP